MTENEILRLMSPRDKEILLSFADNGMRLSRASDLTYMSHNGFKYHLLSVKVKTGLNPYNFYDLYQLVQMIQKERAEYERDS